MSSEVSTGHNLSYFTQWILSICLLFPLRSRSGRWDKEKNWNNAIKFSHVRLTIVSVVYSLGALVLDKKSSLLTHQGCYDTGPILSSVHLYEAQSRDLASNE